MSVRTLLVAVGAGIAGALITLALLTLDPIARRLGVTDPQPMAELAHEVQELADRTATLETRPAAGPFDSAPLTARLDALEKEVGDTLGQAVTSGPEADEALIARITEAVAGRTADTAQRATERLDALAAAADDDRETVRAVGAAQARLVEKLGALETRLTALGASLAEGPSRASLEVGLELLRARVDALAELATTVDVLEGRMEELTRHVAAEFEAVAGRLARLDARSRQSRGIDGRIAAAALTIAEIRDHFESGESFVPAAERLLGLLQDESYLLVLAQRLRGHAQGVATPATLAAELDAIDLETPTATPAGDDWLDRTMDNLGSLVDIQRPGRGADDPLAPVRRAVARGDLDEAARAIAAIDTGDDEKAALWRRRLEARLDAASTLDRLEEGVRDLLASAPAAASSE